MEIERILAIDYGTQRIGLAVSRYTLAEPLKIIGSNEKTFDKINQICEQEEIQRIVVGLSENEMAKKIEAFVEELKTHTDLPIELTDETLSSYSVHKKMKTAKKSKRGGHIDHYAAAEFLQEWLDEHYG